MTVQVLETPNGVKRTQHVKDSCDPEWQETLQFFVDPEKDHILGNLIINNFRWLENDTKVLFYALSHTFLNF